MRITESRSPTHRTRADARIGEGRIRADQGHVGPHAAGKGWTPVALRRPDAQPDRPVTPEPPFRPGNSVVVGENPGVVADKRR